MFKDKLKENRLRLNLSQEELAAKVFVSRSAVAKWEQGRGLPEDESLGRLAALFSVSPDELLTKEDMKQEIEATEKDLTKNKKKTLLFGVIAGVAVLALVSTLLSGALVYNPSGEETAETHTLASAEYKEDRLVAFTLQNGTRFNYSQWQNALFRDEFGSTLEKAKDLNLRKGDVIEFSYLADKNMFGRKRIGSLGLSEIQVHSHLFQKENALFGFGVSFNGAEGAVFAPGASNVAYCRFFELNPEQELPTVDLRSKNLYSISSGLGYGRDKLSVSIAFDPKIISGRTAWPFCNSYSNHWERDYFSMTTGNEASFVGFSTSILGSVTFSLTGAMPNISIVCGYSYVQYNVTLMAKNNPSSYQIKSYDAADSLLATKTILPGDDFSALNLPEERSYSLVQEYQNGGLFSTSEKIGKGSLYRLYFSNSDGFFDRDVAKVTL